jgi:putative ATP-dependent endonuclease of OLD family
MKVAQLEIKNFRGISSAKLLFDGHTLLVGMNNVGKSTVCEALELALGPDRLKRFPPVEEFDFYNARYLDKSTTPPSSIPISIEVVLVELPSELATKCVDRIEHWHLGEKRLLAEGEVDKVDHPDVCECLRIKMVGVYNQDEDEFEAKLMFCGGQPKPDGELAEVPYSIRKLFGFLYLRALRTGSRALSLERGSLLDVILRQQAIRTGIWENAIQQLRDLDPAIDEGAVKLAPVLENIEKRLGQYIPLAGEGRGMQLFVSQLTREHLRKTISFFMKISGGQEPVPFQEAGTGTLNILVLALLSLIADLKKDSVIFAMEEPEIALPPHTQRRIAKYLLENTSQCFVSSHSPYVIERFQPEQVQILRKDKEGVLTATGLTVGTTLKGKIYRRHARRGLAEAMLGCGVIVGEGITEKDMILAAADKMEESDPENCYPLDLSGVSVISVDGEGALAEFGAFFTALGIRSFAFYDAKDRKPEEVEKLKTSFYLPYSTKYLGAERLLVEETAVARLWQLLEEIRDAGEKPGLIPDGPRPSDDKVKEIALSVLKNEKGSGYAGRLIELCSVHELPATLVAFMQKIYAEFKKPAPVPPLEAPEPAVATPVAAPVAPSITDGSAPTAEGAVL